MSTINVSQLKNASAASPAIVLAADGSATAQLSSINGGPLAGMRNRIINGDMRIDQRNNGAAVTTGFAVDRWQVYSTQSSKWSAQRSTIAPTEFSTSFAVTSSSAYTLLSTDYFSVTTRIEGFNTADLGWGTANAKTVTVSFWARSSLTGTFGGALHNNAFNRVYPFSYTISAANTWEQKTITIAGDTTGTWTADNSVGIEIGFSFGAGSSRVAAAGSWSGTADVFSATGQTSVVGTNGATFFLTGVQLEPGTVATPFERRSTGAESLLCLRYYCGQRIDAQLPVPGQSVVRFNFPISMRIPPTITNLVAGSLSNATVALEAGGITNEGFYFQYHTSASNGFIIGRFNAASAEL